MRRNLATVSVRRNPSLFTALTAIGLAVSAPVRSADDPPHLDLKALHAEVRKLVVKHYPKAEVTLKGKSVSFEFHTRKFMIHEPLLTGEWQDAFEEVGPQKGGILGTMALQSGKHGGMADMPQSFDKRYYTVRVMAPYSAKLDVHLYVQLKYPRDAPVAFLKDFEALVEGFDKHVAAPAK